MVAASATLQQTSALLDKFKANFSQGEDKLEHSLQLLAQLKIAILEFASLPPAAPSAPTPQQHDEQLLAREILEYGALLSIKAVDIPSFERHVSQLKTYYTDCAMQLPESQRQYPILGLNLLRLLAQNRIAEFHTELELLPNELQQSNIYIKFPAQLEQHIMEGSYNKVLSAKQDGQYAQEGMYFMDMLVDTVREEIAECSEKAYSDISASELQNLLMLGSEADLSDYADQRGWTIVDGIVTFGGNEEKPLQLPSTQLIQETLAYAKELERIV
mmetsp:Transcript_4142/g.6915  ORF Transcript_4142/g.6915 Transcript_4142/m.6915 type:complete len:273 (-) Transcript_4142:203-1021(-)|eukprot:CAMPEP_0119308994 /NCGR_PEP_ID=MMETSP1333-20130426/13449_1 /TAXON_ID=418940 /ORGANISM="Scyphosphaera apsteinii, Strain RCC1455" /LENGTH=272 /DNA_ID=CAMNT_0007312893 /DNA_START=36 /DNA_END=854 /DNA_ORIENTATION=-